MSAIAKGVTPSGLAYSVVGDGPPLLWLRPRLYSARPVCHGLL
jgi:hypothetical protein